MKVIPIIAIIIVVAFSMDVSMYRTHIHNPNFKPRVI
jgi:hypothetical protein